MIFNRRPNSRSFVSAPRRNSSRCLALHATSRCPQRAKSHAIPSTRTISSTQSMDCSEAAYMRFVASRPYLFISVRIPSFSPLSTIPPFRQLAPQPTFSASNTATRAPPFASVRAADNPVKPPPITATSTLSGNGRTGSRGASTVVNQKFFSAIFIADALSCIGRSDALSVCWNAARRFSSERHVYDLFASLISSVYPLGFLISHAQLNRKFFWLDTPKLDRRVRKLFHRPFSVTFV